MEVGGSLEKLGQFRRLCALKDSRSIGGTLFSDEIAKAWWFPMTETLVLVAKIQWVTARKIGGAEDGQRVMFVVGVVLWV